MTATAERKWESMRTAETRQIEDALRDEFGQVDAYRYNSASIRIRLIDPRFEGLSAVQRAHLYEPHIKRLPKRAQVDIMAVLALAPSELQPDPEPTTGWVRNIEFESPSPSEL